jgi:hypothetical protein
MLQALNRTASAILRQTSSSEMVTDLLLKQQLLFRFAKRFAISEYLLSYTLRKDIYPYIKELLHELQIVQEKN